MTREWTVDAVTFPSMDSRGRHGTPRARRAARLAAPLLALAALAAACGGSDDGGTEAATPAADGGGGPVLDAAVLTGEATTLDGASFDLGGLADKDLVVWFWAPW